jgi:hypothetical protein
MEQNEDKPMAPSESPARAQAGVLLARGVCRMLAAHGLAGVTEMPLANGRRADVMALDRTGDVSIIEVKSSIEDFRADRKWPEYRDFCDRLFFAVPETFPVELIPEDCGLILADGFGAEIVRPASEQRLAAARRKAVVLRFAHLAALRLQRLVDPAAVAEMVW